MPSIKFQDVKLDTGNKRSQRFACKKLHLAISYQEGRSYTDKILVTCSRSSQFCLTLF